jgi:hypothetical protein
VTVWPIDDGELREPDEPRELLDDREEPEENAREYGAGGGCWPGGEPDREEALCMPDAEAAAGDGMAAAADASSINCLAASAKLLRRLLDGAPCPGRRAEEADGGDEPAWL